MRPTAMGGSRTSGATRPDTISAGCRRTRAKSLAVRSRPTVNNSRKFIAGMTSAMSVLTNCQPLPVWPLSVSLLAHHELDADLARFTRPAANRRNRRAERPGDEVGIRQIADVESNRPAATRTVLGGEIHDPICWLVLDTIVERREKDR